MKIQTCLLLTLALAAALPARAEIRLPALFADHMVVQCNATVPVWGWAAPGETVTVEFAGQKKTGTADAAGKWLVKLDPLKPSAEPHELKAGNAVVHDVLVGELWLCGGQSNMERQPPAIPSWFPARW